VKEFKNIDATPSKRIYLSVIADYDLKLAICELIDNSIDSWHRNGKPVELRIEVDIDERQNTIRVQDNAGGIKESEIRLVISPGESKTNDDDETIGIFGVGSKRAAVALSQFIRISSRFENEKTLLVQYDDEWLKKEDWNIAVFEVENINYSSTIIELQKLRINLNKSETELLKAHLSYVYAKFLVKGDMKIKVNRVQITPKFFDDWSYPPQYEPQNFKGKLIMEEGDEVEYSIECGLTKSLKVQDNDDNEEYGIYLYCNDRLVERALKSYEVGFTTGKAGQPHPTLQIVRVIINLKGKSNRMPWNSSKSRLSVNHPVFKELQEQIIEVITTYAKLARQFSNSGGWQETVFRYSTGSVSEVFLPEKEGLRSYLPPIPKTQRVKFGETVKDKNKILSHDKPWVIGLYEAIIAVEAIGKLSLYQKNRISLLILDSTLEIAFKEYLVNDSGSSYADARLQTIFGNRTSVHTEIQNSSVSSMISADHWKKINHYYKVRCELVHKRATLTVTDEDIVIFRELVEEMLKILFGVECS
jgi:Histidine kinase-, DNA gyrase B-, and HSP90-like ATPase